MIKQSNSGLKSKESILNAVAKRMTLGKQDAVIFVSYDVSLEDVISWVSESFRIESGVMHTPNYVIGDNEHYLQLFLN